MYVDLEKDLRVHRPLPYRGRREVIPTETNDFRHTEGYHEIYARDKLSSKYIYEKNKKNKVKETQKNLQ